MLKTLTVENVALIKKAVIDFGGGLNVLSGETGAGKSVLLESVNFVLGARADKTMICRGERSCSVTAVFDVEGGSIIPVLNDMDIEADDELIIKRVLHEDGRSNIRINGEPVTAQMLRRITSLLVDVHGQSDHFVLLNEASQLALIDSLGAEKIDAVKNSLSEVIAKIKETDENLKKLGGDENERKKRIDYIDYCLEEIKRADYKENEDIELLARKKKLQNAEKIAQALGSAVNALSGDGGVLDLLGDSVKNVDSITAYGIEYEALSARLSAALEDINDVSETLSSSFDEDFDPKEIDVIEARLDELSVIKRKYGESYEAVRIKREELEKERNLLLDADFEAGKLVEIKRDLYIELNKRYDELTAIRKAVSKDLSEKLIVKLKELAMAGAAFEVAFTKKENVLSSEGNDEVCFMFSANVGETVKPLSKIISGGELSRLMLAIKTVSGRNVDCFTYIFDEIDAGISGNAAFTVAENFAQIALNRQIIAVSHLPQIVAMADNSIYIYKETLGDRTYTQIKPLSDNEKVGEVIRLIGGKMGDESSFVHAKNLIDRATAYKNSIN